MPGVEEEDGEGSREEKKLSNEIECGLKNALQSAVGNSDYQQKTVLSAAIDQALEQVDGQDGIYVVDENLEDELEEWSDLYS